MASLEAAEMGESRLDAKLVDATDVTQFTGQLVDSSVCYFEASTVMMSDEGFMSESSHDTAGTPSFVRWHGSYDPLFGNPLRPTVVSGETPQHRTTDVSTRIPIGSH